MNISSKCCTLNDNVENKNTKPRKRGFTLIELLVVISIIALLSSVVLASLTTAREKARDTARIATLKQIELALEMYKNDHGKYPGQPQMYYMAHDKIDGYTCGYTHSYSPQGAWCDLGELLEPYLPDFPRGEDGIYRQYTYKHYATNDTYGLKVTLESSSHSAAVNDGGYASSWFEVGQLPSYCRGAYTGSDANWTFWSGSTACVGGN